MTDLLPKNELHVMYIYLKLCLKICDIVSIGQRTNDTVINVAYLTLLHNNVLLCSSIQWSCDSC